MPAKSTHEDVLNHNLRYITEDRKRTRELFLLIMFEQSFGDECRIPYRLISEETQKFGIFVEDAAGYLEKRGLIKWIPEEEFNHPTMPGPGLMLTHQGVIEAENLVAKRLGSEEQQPIMTKENVQTVIQHFNAPVASVQTGHKNTARVSQRLGVNTSELLQLISQLREAIHNSDLADKEDALEVVEALNEEVKREEPRKGRLKAFMRQLGEFTSNTASNVIATAISQQIGLG